MHRWPTVLTSEELTLRPLRVRDERAWSNTRARNTAWLTPWDVSDPMGAHRQSFGSWARQLRRQGKKGSSLPLVMEIGDDGFAGQLMVNPITYGAARTAVIGYWIAQEYAGFGYTPKAVALTCDYLVTELGINRIEINIRPENAASLRVVQKLGCNDEGLARELLFIDGAYRDHRRFSLLAADRPELGFFAALTG